MTNLLWIAAGGAAGSVLRYLTSGWGQRLVDGPFPLGTLLVNVGGCLAIGYLATLLLAGPALVREELRMAVLVGFLGGFTTFSTFGYETFQLLADREWALAAANVVLSNTFGLAALWAGYRVAIAQGG